MSWIKDCILLALIVGILFGATLGKYPLAAPDAARYAEIPREMVVTGNYLTPHLNSVKYFEKPPLFYWLQAASIKVLGVNEFAANLVNALMGLFSCLLVYLVGRSIFGRLSGFLASIVLATTSLFFAMSQLTTLDMALAFFVSATLSCFLLATQKPLSLKRDCCLWMMYIFAALAVMTKGLVGAAFPAMIIFLYVLIFNEWRNLKTYRIFSGILLFLIIALPWHILVQLKNPEFFHFYFIEQHFLRYLTPYAGRQQPWWFFPAVLLGGFFPWVMFLPQSLVHCFPRSWQNFRPARPTIFLLLWAIFIYTFYSFSDSKLIPYLLPVFPPLAILIGNYLASCWHAEKKLTVSIGWYSICILNLLLGIAALVACIVLNFKTQAITRENLLITGNLFIFSAIVLFIIYKRKNFSKAFTAFVIAFALVLLSLCPMLPIINNHSIKPLAIALKQQLHPDDEVISYQTYYQDLPFYLERRIIVADYKGELEFGTQHQDTSAWIIDPQTFLKRILGAKKVYIVMSTTNYNELNKQLPGRLKLQFAGLNDVVLTN